MKSCRSFKSNCHCSQSQTLHERDMTDNGNHSLSDPSLEYLVVEIFPVGRLFGYSWNDLEGPFPVFQPLGTQVKDIRVVLE